jgi:hypothetical protein
MFNTDWPILLTAATTTMEMIPPISAYSIAVEPLQLR